MGASESKDCDCKCEESNTQAVLPVAPSVDSLTNKVDDVNKGQTVAEVATLPPDAEQDGGRYKKNRKRSRKNIKKISKRSKGSNKNRL